MSVVTTYYSFSPSRADKKWLNFVSDIPSLRTKEIPLNYLAHKDAYNYGELTQDLKLLDITYGSVTNEDFEDPKIEWTLLNVILEVSGLRKVNEVYSSNYSDYLPTRNEWIKLHQNLKTDIIKEAIHRLMQELDWDDAEWGEDSAKKAVISYLKSIKPVLKDLKETPDAIFISRTDGITEVEPASADILLMERAKEHAMKFKGALPPIL